MSIYESTSGALLNSLITGPTLQALDHGQPVLRSITTPLVRAAMTMLTSKDLPSAIFLKNGRELLRVLVQDILFLQADGNYVEFHLKTRRIVMRCPMAEALGAMPGAFLVPVNRSQAVNILLIETIYNDEVLMGDKGFTLSKRYRDGLLSKLMLLSDR